MRLEKSKEKIIKMTKKDKKNGVNNKYIGVNKIIHWFKAHKARWIIPLLLLIFFLWAAIINPIFRSNPNADFQTAEAMRGDLIAIVGATGIVEANQTAELYWQTTGRVASVFFQVDDTVKAGEILADLADNSLPQSVIFAQAELVEAQRTLENLVNSNTESAEVYKNLLQVEKDLRTAEDNRDRWNYKDTDWELIYSARQIFVDAEEDLKTSQTTFDAVVDLGDEDPLKINAKNDLDEKQLARDQAIRSLNNLLGKIYDQQVADDFAEYDIVLAKLGDAQREWERVKDGPNSDDISAAEAKVAAAEATVSLGWLQAPISGTLTRALPKVGDYVDIGDLGFRIDDLGELFVLVDISEVDINRLAVGQKAELSFDGISGKTYLGIITGVSSVGEDRGSGVVFEVTVKILDADDQVRPGMTAAVNIIVSEIVDVLIVPNRAIRLNNGQRVVYILKDGQLNEVSINIGASSDTQTEIVEGNVNDGDVVVLNPPTVFQSNGGPPPFVRR